DDIADAEGKDLFAAVIADGEDRTTHRGADGDGIRHAGIADRQVNLSLPLEGMTRFDRAVATAGDPEYTVEAVRDATVAVGRNQREVFLRAAGKAHADGIAADIKRTDFSERALDLPA